MSVRAVRALVVAYLALMLAATTWPGMLLASRIRPLILGLPFACAWGAAWIVVAVFVLWGWDRSERRTRRDEEGR
jgi:hypothetical protein